MLGALLQFVVDLYGGEGCHLQAAALRIRSALRVFCREPRQPLLLKRCWALATEGLLPVGRWHCQPWACGHPIVGIPPLLLQDVVCSPGRLRKADAALHARLKRIHVAHPGAGQQLLGGIQHKRVAFRTRGHTSLPLVI